MPQPRVKSPLFASLGVAGVLAVLLMVVFAMYVVAEKQIDTANEQRYEYRKYADELRGSSDNLTRLVRSYVQTGDLNYKESYFNILDVRNGKAPRQVDMGRPRWTWEPGVHSSDETPRRAIALLDELRSAGLTPEEFSTLSQAKARSDQLAITEMAAMRLFEVGDLNAQDRRQRASDLLYSSSYREAKVNIYQDVNDFNRLTEARTANVVHQATQYATLLRLIFILLTLSLLMSLWRAYRVWRTVLGGSFAEVHMQITRLGQGDFSVASAVSDPPQSSVLGWLAQTVRQLETSTQARNEAHDHLQRLSRLYETQSECSKAMVYCTSETDLYATVCKALVEQGGLQMAWIGHTRLENLTVQPLTAFGKGAEFLQQLQVTYGAQSETGQGPTGMAIRSDQAVWCQNFQEESKLKPWHPIGQQYGWSGVAALPLHRDGQVMGVLVVYPDRVNAFDPAAQKLLMELAADLDYATKNLDLAQARAVAEAKILESETRLMLALKGTRDALWDWNITKNEVYFSPQWWNMIGYAPNELTPDASLWRKIMHPQDMPLFDSVLRTLPRSKDDTFSLECRLIHRDGHAIPILVRGFVVRDANGRAQRFSGTNMDLTERKQVEQLDSMRNFMLEKLNSTSSLEQILLLYALEIERQCPPALCSILLLDDEGLHLTPGAAPSLPAFYVEALAREPIGPSAGSCGTAAFTGQRVVVGEIATHPYWTDYKDLAQQANLASCWSEPILSGNGKVLGTFAMYHHLPALPDAQQIKIIELAAHFTAVAIERKQAEMQLQLVARVFEQGGEVIVITDSHSRIVRVNNAFTKVTGYTEAEAIGQNPSMLSSGRQDAEFYRAMWTSIHAHDQWHGEMWNRRKDGSVYPEWLSISVLRDGQGAISNYVAIATDISKRKQDEEHIRQLADFDPLTHLPNRRLLQDRVENALERALRNTTPVALMFLDLDRFKQVNDSLGHHIGDELLIQVAQRLKAVLREQDTVCRLGGDEFVLLLPDTDATGAANVAHKLLAFSAERYLIDQQELSITFSVGIALYPNDGDSFATLSMSADTAMYRAKQSGRNSFCFFTAEMQVQSNRALQLENGLRRALEEQQLFLVYQPQTSLKTGKVIGVEALIRWQHPTLGLISPADFIPVAEESGLILPIGEWVLRTACKQLHDWRDAGLDLELVAVNVSAVQFRNAKLPALVSQVLLDCGLPAQHLELELTEGVAMENPVVAIETMRDLFNRGVRLSIDDFGTGYSSLNYLKRFQIYKLKIDQSFVRDVTDDPDDRAIVTAIIGLARSLGYTTIAEGVETLGQLDFLREQGCDEVQGYFHSRPLTASALEAYVRTVNST